MLVQIINCLDDRPKLLISLTAVLKLKADFLPMEVQSNVDSFEKINRRLKAIFYDGNRTKQNTFKNTKKNS